MGLADRDYLRADSGRGRGAGLDYGVAEYTPRPPVGGVRMFSVTTWLIIINVAVFFLGEMIRRPIVDEFGRVVGYVAVVKELGYWSIDTAMRHFQIWRFITFQFLHASLIHVFFNMFVLYMFGPMIESYLGRRRFLAFYLLSGIGGPIAYTLFWATGVWGTSVSAAIPLIGASAGVFGVLVAAARIAPNTTVLIYGSIPAKLKTVAWVLLGIAFFTVFTSGNNAGGEAAHLGGAAVGFFLIVRPHLLNVFEYGYHSHRPRMRYR